MSHQDQLIVTIAIACGIDIEQYRSEDGSINTAALPQYSTDLNACRQMEEVIMRNDRWWQRYKMALVDDCVEFDAAYGDVLDSETYMQTAIRAGAQRRARASTCPCVCKGSKTRSYKI